MTALISSLSEWKHLETKKLVEDRWGLDAAKDTAQASRSVHWKLAIAAYHAEELNIIIQKLAPDYVAMSEQIFLHAGGGQPARAFLESQLKIEAHLVACAQALHSVGDILSQVIYYAMGLRLVLQEDDVTLSSVIGSFIKRDEAITLRKELQLFQESAAFKYLSAYVNTIKHRRLVRSRSSVHFQPQPRKYGFRVLGFSYKGNEYPQTWTDVISSQYRFQIQDKAVVIGVTLNSWLKTA